jgi:hypothetical protein
MSYGRVSGWAASTFRRFARPIIDGRATLAGMGDDPQRAAEDQREEQRAAADVAATDERDSKGRFGAGNPFRFPPGASGNPLGRPKGIGDLIDRVIREEMDTAKLGKRETQELMIRVMVQTALKGGSSGTQAFRELMDRRYGRVPIALKVGPDESEGPRDFRVRIVGRDDVDRDAMRVPAKPKPAVLIPTNGSGNGNGNGDQP